MTKLDETGLEAAYAALAPDLHKGYSRGECARMAEATITAYLAAARTSDALRDLQRLGQECEGDRLAVVVSDRGGIAAALMLPDQRPSRALWEALERNLGPATPWRRQIVRCNLLRPEPVGEVVGSVDDA